MDLSEQKNILNNGKATRETLTLIVKAQAEALTGDPTIDLSTLKELNEQLDKEWNADGFEAPTFSGSVVTTEGLLIKFAANESLEKNPDFVDARDITIRVFVGGEQKDVVIPADFRAGDMNFRDTSVQTTNLYDISEKHIANALRYYGIALEVTDDLKWLTEHLGSRLDITSVGDPIILTNVYDDPSILGVNLTGIEST